MSQAPKLVEVEGFIVPPKMSHCIVETGKTDPLMLEARYASANNICKRPLYRRPALYLRSEAWVALQRAHQFARPFSLWVFDAYRPEAVQRALWERCPNPDYVADPDGKGSMHTRGVAVDLTLAVGAARRVVTGQKINPSTAWFSAEYEEMGTNFDEMTKAAHWDAYEKGLTDGAAHGGRKTLAKAMRKAGFETIPTEWWHWELPGDWPLLDEREMLEEPLSHPDLLQGQ